MYQPNSVPETIIEVEHIPDQAWKIDTVDCGSNDMQQDD